MSGISDKSLKTPYAENKYRYNGKELQNQEFSDGTGLEEYDYGARMQDPQLGRWWVIDINSEDNNSVTPYAYVLNSPVVKRDPDGLSDSPAPIDASTFITPGGQIIYHVNDGDPTIYVVPKPGQWNGQKNGLSVFGYENPTIDYDKNVGKNIRSVGFLTQDPRKYPYDPAFSPDFTIERSLLPLGAIVKLLRALNFIKSVSDEAVNITDKIAKQMQRRGWDGDAIEKTAQKPYATSEATNKATGGDATAYFNKDGSYIIKDNQTGDVIQISNKNDPGWVPDQTIKNPYKPPQK
jgi:RHS repeat-associated protein